jgi:hypothetical protein
MQNKTQVQGGHRDATDKILDDLSTRRSAIDPSNTHRLPTFDWAGLVGLTVHPVKVAIVEALLWVGYPMSVHELSELLAELHYNGDVISYHTTALLRLGAIEVTHVRRVRGAREHYYFLLGTGHRDG